VLESPDGDCRLALLDAVGRTADRSIYGRVLAAVLSSDRW
jgi:hypothetical protein